MEEEFRSVQGMVEAKEHALRAMKKTLVRKMDLARQEMEDLEQVFITSFNPGIMPNHYRDDAYCRSSSRSGRTLWP